MTTKPKTPRAQIVTDKAMSELLKRKALYYRETLEKSDDPLASRCGLSSYVLFGVIHSRGLIEVIDDEPTAADFNQYVTAKAKAAKLQVYDNLVEYRDAGSRTSPKVTILCWEATR